jgi:hypothetical protein
MRLLIDECIDERLRLLFPAYECQTARFAGLAGLKRDLQKQLTEWQRELGLELADCGCPPRRDDLLAELSFSAAAGHTSPTLGLQSLDLSKLNLRAMTVDSVAESGRRSAPGSRTSGAS